jgi:hypothetical protein
MKPATKTLRINHPEFGLIIKANLEASGEIKQLNFSLPRKATKLEKLLLKYVEIYSYDVLRNNMYNVVLESKEYTKFLGKARKKS